MFLDTSLRRLCTSSLVLVVTITTMELKNGTNCPFVVHVKLFVRDYDAINLFYFSRWVMMFHLPTNTLLHKLSLFVQLLCFLGFLRFWDTLSGEVKGCEAGSTVHLQSMHRDLQHQGERIRGGGDHR